MNKNYQIALIVGLLLVSIVSATSNFPSNFFKNCEDSKNLNFGILKKCPKDIKTTLEDSEDYLKCFNSDVNWDEEVSQVDIGVVKSCLFHQPTGECETSDVNNDGVISIFDLGVIKSNLGCDVPNAISECQTISDSGVYVLNQDISTTGTCLKINSNATVNLNGFKISGDGFWRNYGVYINNSSPILSNGKISNFGFGIFLENSNNSEVYNLSIEDFTEYGIKLKGSDFNDIQNIQTNLSNEMFPEDTPIAFYLGDSNENYLNNIEIKSPYYLIGLWISEDNHLGSFNNVIENLNIESLSSGYNIDQYGILDDGFK